jgi:hypothetical protein
MGDKWSRRLHGIGVSDDYGSYMSIMHYEYCSIFIHYNPQCAVSWPSRCERYGVEIALFYTVFYKGVYPNIQVYSHSHPAPGITFESSLQGREFLHPWLVDQATISAKGDS